MPTSSLLPSLSIPPTLNYPERDAERERKASALDSDGKLKGLDIGVSERKGQSSGSTLPVARRDFLDKSSVCQQPYVVRYTCL